MRDTGNEAVADVGARVGLLVRIFDGATVEENVGVIDGGIPGDLLGLLLGRWTKVGIPVGCDEGRDWEPWDGEVEGIPVGEEVTLAIVTLSSSFSRRRLR